MLCAMCSCNLSNGSRKDLKIKSVKFCSFSIISLCKPKNDFCLIEIGLVVLENKCEQLTYRQTDGRTNDRQHVIRKAYLSFQLRLTY